VVALSLGETSGCNRGVSTCVLAQAQDTTVVSQYRRFNYIVTSLVFKYVIADSRHACGTLLFISTHAHNSELKSFEFEKHDFSHPAALKNVTKCSSLASFRTNLIHVRSCQTLMASFSALIASGKFSENKQKQK
jgi:hypothetical protein